MQIYTVDMTVESRRLAKGTQKDFDQACERVVELLPQMTEEQYRKFNFLLSVSTAVQTGVEVRTRHYNLIARWGHLIRKLLLLQQEIMQNDEDTDTRHFSSYECDYVTDDPPVMQRESA